MTTPAPRLRSLLTCLLTCLVAVGLALAAGGSAPAAGTASTSLSATAAAAEAASTAAAQAKPPRKARQACQAKRQRVAKRVTRQVARTRSDAAARKAGRKAGRKAYRRCIKAATPPTTTPPTTPTNPAPNPAPVPGDPTDPAPPSTVTFADTCLDSVPEPGSSTPVKICLTVVRPAGSSADAPVPMVLHSHGWGGSRTTDATAFRAWTDRGYGVLSFDQRGFGESGGQAHVENPAYEGEDVTRIVDYVARLPWVVQERRGDPLLGAIGGSYGGGYQYLTAFETRGSDGVSKVDAMAPEITWNDLLDSLAPSGVVRSAWALALTAGAAPTDALPQEVLNGLALGLAQGSFPDSLRPFFEKNGPKWQVANRGALDIPMLLGQGTTDGLFPLEQGLTNFQRALTPGARARSIFVGYNGGHVLPAVLPAGISITSDPCSAQLLGRAGTFADLTRDFFDEQLKGKDRGVRGYGEYHLATPQDTCVTVDSVVDTTTYPVAGPLANVAGPAGAPTAVEVAKGPITVAGTPWLEADVTSLGLDGRLFLGLAAGTSPLDAKPIQNNLLPLRVPGLGGSKVHLDRIDLPSVATQVPAGQNLYLLATPIQDTFVGMGTRVPVPMVLDNLEVRVPVR